MNPQKQQKKRTDCPYRLSHIIAVPMSDGSWAIGVIIRTYKSKWAAVSYVGFVDDIGCIDQVMNCFHKPSILETFISGRLGLLEGRWCQLGALPGFKEENWPLPLAKVIVGNELRLMELDETLVQGRIVPGAPVNWSKIYPPGLSGHLYVETILQRIKNGGERPAVE